MNTHSKYIPLALIGALLGSPAIIAPLQAASLGFVSETHISSSGDFKVSVYNGKAGYSGLVSGTFGDGTVEAYALFRNASASNVTPLDRYAHDGTPTFSFPTFSNTTTTGSTFENADVWTSNNPGTNFSGGDTANFGGSVLTISGAYNVSGTIDISNFLSGTVYVLAGTYGNTINVNLSMSGTGQTTLSAINGALRTNSAPASRNTYVFAYTFDNSDKLYNRITYSFLNSGENAANRARFMGVVMDAVRPPGAVPISPIGNAIVSGPSTNLVWTKSTPNTGSDVWSDVWYGTDPGALTKILDATTSAANLTTTSLPITAAGTHYWRVDNYLAGSPTGTPVIGPVVSFVVNDSDGDGFPDAYELLHTGTPQGLNAGDDLENGGAGDGLTNLQEFNLGTNPTLADTDSDGLDDGPELAGVGSRPATSPILADTDADGIKDGIETNTGNWVNAANTGTNPVNTDTDADGLKDGAENNTGTFVDKNATGTSPLNPDKDGDGVGDWYEVMASFTNPTIASEKPKVPYPLPDPDGSTGVTNKPVKVYIMSGQSNMLGFGKVSGTGTDALETMTRRENKFPNLIDNNGNYLSRQDVHYRGLISGSAYIGPLLPGCGTNSDSIGPELGFGQIMGWFHDEPVLLLKPSIGNRSLGWDILPPASVRHTFGINTYPAYGESPKSWPTATGNEAPARWYAGKQYDDYFLHESNMGARPWVTGTFYPSDANGSCQIMHNRVPYIATASHTSAAATEPGVGANWASVWSPYSVTNVVDVLDNFATNYPQWAVQGFEIAGFVWWQGDKDRGDAGHAARYEQNLVQLITTLRTYYSNRYPGKVIPNAPFVLATLGQTALNAAPSIDKTLLDAMLAVDGGKGIYPQFAGNVKTVYSYPLSEGGASNTHYDLRAGTYMLVGDALGRAMLDLQPSTPPPANDYDTWADEYGSADLSDPNADYDGDGQTNNQERIWGLNPTSGASSNPISVPFNPATGTLSYTRRTSALNTGVSYRYEWSATLAAGSWQEFTPSNVVANGATPVESVTITLPAGLLGDPKLFVRVVGTSD